MLGTPFTHDIIRKYVIAYGTLFNDIKLQRIDPEEAPPNGFLFRYHMPQRKSGIVD